MRLRVPAIVVHFLCCFAFLALPYVFTPERISPLSSLIDDPHELTSLLTYVLMLLFFYSNYYWLVPKLYFNRRYVFYGLSVLASFLLILSLLLLLDRQDLFREPHPNHPAMAVPPPPDLFDRRADHSDRPFMPKPPVGPEMSSALYLFLVGLLVSLSLRINSRLRESEQARLTTELSYLKAQINPHFLFNTLNSIYALAIEKSDDAPDAITRLSALMRYVLGEATNEQVPLANDLAYLRNYVSLQQTRLADTVVIDFQQTGSLTGLSIAPLILISFIENAFKYGVNPESAATIRIAVLVQNRQLHLSVWNAKVRRLLAEDSSFGIGISNTAARLKLLYPNRHLLRLEDKPDSFGVDLTIDL